MEFTLTRVFYFHTAIQTYILHFPIIPIMPSEILELDLGRPDPYSYAVPRPFALLYLHDILTYWQRAERQA
jgi:hypothetical protein